MASMTGAGITCRDDGADAMAITRRRAIGGTAAAAPVVFCPPSDEVAAVDAATGALQN